MNIREEYARLCVVGETKEGWNQIENAWFKASNFVFKNNEWVKERVSSGNQVSGFAIALDTWKCEIGTKGCDHKEPYLILCSQIAKDKPELMYEEVKVSVLEGRRAHVAEWKFPLVSFSVFWITQDLELLKELEEQVLKQEIGLPLTSLYMKHQ